MDDVRAPQVVIHYDVFFSEDGDLGWLGRVIHDALLMLFRSFYSQLKSREFIWPKHKT